MTFAQRQRTALLDLMTDLGPLAPTRCEGWQVQDLAAHLYVRENRPSALLGIGWQRFASLTQRIQTEELHRHGFVELVRRLRRVKWFMRPLDMLAGAAEWFIHHEDVLRANGLSQRLDSREQQQLWRVVLVLARRAQFAFGERVVLHRSDTGAEASLGRGSRTVHLSGLPSELLLTISGRDAETSSVAEPDTLKAWHGAVRSL